ncbi:MAG: cyclic nucleotide-binding domain-containing protein [Bacteroidetes bacterium]|nr:cyclic nucleotide-binding domain-containing protein [Bacteroidota bacterium]
MNKIFSGVSDSEIDSLINPNNLLHINEGDVIYQTGDDTNELYLLLRGNVKIKFPSHNYISNKIFNDFFGEKELFENTRRNSSAVAINNCLLYLVKKSDLESFFSKSHSISRTRSFMRTSRTSTEYPPDPKTPRKTTKFRPS